MEVLQRTAVLTAKIRTLVNKGEVHARIDSVRPLFFLWKKAEQSGDTRTLQVRLHYAIVRKWGDSELGLDVAEQIATLAKNGEYDVLTAAWEWLWTDGDENEYL